MTRTEKQENIKELQKVFNDHPGIFLFGFSGINVPDVTELRREITRSGNAYRVVKNRLALRASKGTRIEPLADHFQGPTAVAYSLENPVGLAKVFKKFAEDHPGLQFKAGVLEETVLDESDLKSLAEMPSRDELLSKLVYLLQAPLSRLAGALQSPVRNLGSVLKQLAESKSK